MTVRSMWFDGCVNPVRVGWYEVLLNSIACRGIHMRFWNGENWSRQDTNNPIMSAVCVPQMWRGAAYKVT